MGIQGAGLANAIGSVISLGIMATHFLSKKNTLKLVIVYNFGQKLRKIVAAGFSTFFVDVAMGIVTVLINNQIMKYACAEALSVYGVIVNISTCAQGCAYSIGQAAQPIISINLGAEKWQRIKTILKYSLITAAVFSIFWSGITLLFPVPIIKIFMSATPEVINLAPKIFRLYCLSFLLLPLNVFSTYYFQSILKPKTAFTVSVCRGLVISGSMILILPVIGNDIGLWPVSYTHLYCTNRNFEARQDHFVCSTSRLKGKEVCPTHFIRTVVLEQGVLTHMRMTIACVANHEEQFRKAMGAKQKAKAKKELAAKRHSRSYAVSRKQSYAVL